MIVETSSNQLFKVWDAADPNLSHVWVGLEVRKTKRTVGIPGVPNLSRVETVFVPKAKARELLVRKTGCRVVVEE